jgi:hypothetical protein
MPAPPATPEQLAWYDTERRFAQLADLLASHMGPGCYWSARADIATWRAQYGDEGAYRIIAETILRLQGLESRNPHVSLSAGDPELVAAWAYFPDPVLAHPNGEVLQYMGSYERATGWVHTFRHRCHPETGERTYWHVPATAGWAPTSGVKEERDDHLS